MGPFNKRQVGYIKALAGTNDHQTVYSARIGGTQNLLHVGPTASGGLGYARSAQGDDRMSYVMYTIGEKPAVYGHGSGDTTAQDSIMQQILSYNIVINDDRDSTLINQRCAREFWLEKVHARIRLIQPISASDHMEYRMVIFRHKEKQHADVRYASNFSNPLNDMFLARNGRFYGPEGFRALSQDGDNDYAPHASYNNNYDSQSMLQDPFNKKDYVVMKDCRFYLGTEYGGKHIFEDNIVWDHQDAIDTDRADITTTESDKNYCWYIWIGYCDNTGTDAPADPYVRIDTVTTGTSG